MKNILDTTKTIVAIATPIGVGGVSIVRMSGDKSAIIADKLFKSITGKLPSEFNKRELTYGKFTSETVSDYCLCVVFSEPNSFTGEEVVEFQCHGGIKLTEEVLKSCLEKGAVLAQNGEFSMRAFLNTKMSLSEAEGMIDMINAESEAELKAGFSLLSGGLTKKVKEMQDKIVDSISEIEVSFDYPEEDIEYKTTTEILTTLKNIENDLIKLIETSKTGSTIKNGINTAIVGKPNVGKSSILNSLLEKDKAIVTDIAGTTRDVIEDSFLIKGIKVNIIDTAGIRETEELIEKIGVEKSKDYVKSADIVLFVVDNSTELTNEDKAIYELIKDKKHIIVSNKVDKKEISNKSFFNNEKICFVSAVTKKGINELKQAIYDTIIDKNVISSNIIITNNRHFEILKKALEYISNAINNINKSTLDVITIDLMNVFETLGEITGTTNSDTIINSIFSKFCLGK